MVVIIDRWCIVGVSDQFVNARIDNDLYTRYIVDLHSHVLRHNHRPNAQSSTSNGDDLSVNCLKITQIDEYPFVYNLFLTHS
jgi:hypothetical protein